MRILYDHQVFSLQNAGGASRYHYELARHLVEDHSVRVTALLGFSATLCPFSSLPSNGSRVVCWHTSLRPGLLRYALNDVATGTWSLTHGRWDIYHPTLYRKLPWIRSRRIAVTHHDCVHERFPRLFTDAGRIIAAKKRLFAAADVIICVSESSRNDLLEFYQVPQWKARVVYHGVSPLSCGPEAATPFATMPRRPYLLYVGARPSYKNFLGLIKAYAKSGLTRDFDLLAIGGAALTAAEQAVIAGLGLAERILLLPNADDAVLAEAYRRAHLFVYPSLYEGFGFPPLEAMSLGCPVLAAKSSSIPEVCGDGVTYFSPEEPDSLVEALRCAIADPGREQRIRKGKEIASRYKWSTCAAETLKIYSEL